MKTAFPGKRVTADRFSYRMGVCSIDGSPELVVPAYSGEEGVSGVV